MYMLMCMNAYIKTKENISKSSSVYTFKFMSARVCLSNINKNQPLQVRPNLC